MQGLDVEVQSGIYDRFYKASSELYAKNIAALDAFKNAPSIEKLLALCDSDKRWANYGRLKRHHALLKAAVLGNYVEDILRPRNFLAHGVPEMLSPGEFVFRYQSREYHFNDKVSTDLRHTIIVYKNALRELFQKLNA